MIKQALHEGWTVRPISNLSEVPAAIAGTATAARVPGCVHTDLLRAGLIDDPYLGDNEPKQLWIGRTDWQYTTSFDADPRLFDHERIDLVADGLDTVATIILNGSEVARTQNMHRGYRFDVRKHLRKGRNELTILFESPVNHAAKLRDKLGRWPAIIYGGHFNFIRKMACNFGWDWGPIVPTCGIWRGIRLEAWSFLRMHQVTPVIDSLTVREAMLLFKVEVEHGDDPSSIAFHPYLQYNDGRDAVDEFDFEQVSKTRLDVRMRLEDPKLWWPANHGKPFRYKFGVHTTIPVMPDGIMAETHMEWDSQVGLRTVELDTSPDDIGSKFVLKVNGKPIFCKGFNWIPDDCFLDRACEPGRVRRRIQQALDANANMLRVWGGGIYETDEFYDICDEMGMLVWQDFLFACATYPETEPIKSEVEAEARYNVARLAHHPSLVLWNGCNENIWGYHVWWDKDEKGEPKPWKDLVAGKGWGAGYYLDLLPKIVKELDGSRPYWAASPWSGDPDIENGLHPNLATHGNKHIWEVWHGKEGEYSNYRKFSPRFCSEFGYQGPPNYATLVAAIGKEGMKRGSKLLELHQKSPGAQEKNDRLLEKDFVIPVDNFDDWHYLLQLNQARALMAGVDWFRSRQPVCMGTLYWQLNDCYPVTSWSAIDSDGRLKPLWFATQQFYAPRRLTIQPNGAEYSIGAPLTLFAMNDTDEPWRESVVLQHVDFEKGAIEQTTRELRIDAAARSMCAIPISAALLSPKAPERQCLVCTARPGGERAMWFFLPDKQLDYPDARFTSDIKRNGDITVLNLRVGTLMRDVVLAPDRLDPDATPLSNLITMLPGEMAELKVRSSKDLPGEQLIRPPVLQCANRFGRTSA